MSCSFRAERAAPLHEHDAAAAAATPEVVPLTFQQRWLWELMQKHPEWSCTVTSVYRIMGSLNIGTLEQSLAEVLRRHGSLRARIVTIRGTPMQRIDAAGELRLQRMLVRGASEAEVEDNAKRWVEESIHSKTGPHDGPLLNIRLLELSEGEHWLVLAVHRLLGDCSATEQVFRELWTANEHLLRGLALPFSSAPAQYADYALWQLKTADEWERRHLAYWQKRLDGAAPVLLPMDAGAAAASPGAIGRMKVPFGEALSTALRDLARRERTLPAAAMLSVYVAALWRWCAQRDFILPVKIAGRQSEHRSIVGYFTSILYLRLELKGTESFRDLLSQVSNEFFRALAHNDLGRMATQEPRLLSGVFFQWITSHSNDFVGEQLPGEQVAPQLTAKRLPSTLFAEDSPAVPPGMVDVEMTFFDTAEGICGSGLYRADRLTPKTIARFVEDLPRVAEQLVRDPKSRFDGLDSDRPAFTQAS